MSATVSKLQGVAAGGRATRLTKVRTDAPLKRTMDVALAVLALLLLIPVIVCVAAAIRISTGSGVLYAHRRVGRNGRPFACLKFQTMVPDGDACLARHLAENPDAARQWQTDRKLKDDPRVTRLGRVLRATSLDEIPQLLNILSGDMSWVGPRPIVYAELEKYGSAARDYFTVRPGLTGLWQVSGRSRLTYAERVEFDRHYVRNRSILLDLSILARTLPAVARRAETS